MAVNEDLKDRAVDHAAMSRRVEMTIQKKLDRVSNRHDTKLFRMVSTGNMRGIAGEVRRVSTEAFVEARDSLTDLVRADTDFHSNSLNKAVRGTYKVKSPNQRGISKLVTDTPIRDRRTLVKHFGDIGSGEMVRLTSLFRRATREGMTPRQTANMLRSSNVTKVSRNQMRSLTRTAITQVSSGASMLVMNENEEILKGFQFNATLDSRTTPICAHHDGKIYTKEEGNTPPLHWRCRSLISPVMKDYNEIQAVPDQSRLTNKKLKGKRAGYFDGAIPAIQTYGDWLRRQPLALIERHTGSYDAANLFVQGRVLLSSFTTKSGKAMSIQSLRRMDNRATSTIPTTSNAASAAKFASYKVNAVRPDDIISNPAVRQELLALYRADAGDIKSTLSTTDYRGILPETKKNNRRRLNSRLVEDTATYRDPFTGETRSTLIYQPDHAILDERILLVRNSTQLSTSEKRFIEDFSTQLEGHISTNQQSAVVENLRILFERYSRNPQDWLNAQAVIRGEIRTSVLNVSRRLETNARSSNNVFKGVIGENIEDALLGQTTLKELTDNLIRNRLSASAWETGVSRVYAADLYVRGRFPLGIYFDNLSAALQQRVRDTFVPRQYDQLVTAIKAVREFSRDPTLNFRAYLQRFTPKSLRESFEDYVSNQFRSAIRSVSPVAYFAKVLPVPTLGLDALAGAVRLVASGKLNDFDQLAVAIGKQLRQDFTEPDLFSPNINSYRRDGARILQSMIDRKLIRINTVETRKRRLHNNDTNIDYGPWVETTSRQVELLDPGLLAYARLNRRIEIAERVGVLTPAQQLRVTRRNVNYTAGGPLNIETSRSLVTRSAAGTFDPDIIDGDIRDTLNHAMSVDWEVDNDFADFMLHLVRYRDRDDIQKYDELNGFRQTVLERGQEGFGFIKTVDFHRQRGMPFKLIAQIDARGRVYYRGYLTPTGGEVVRPFLNIGRPKALGPAGYQEFLEQTGALIAGNDALTTTARIAAAVSHLDRLVELGRLVTQNRPSSVRKILENPLVQSAGGEEMGKLLRFALEHYRLNMHLGNNYSRTNVDRLSRTFMTQLTVEVDASSSGAQIISLSTRNRELAEKSNVVPTRSKNRLYDIIAERAYSDPRVQRIIQSGIDINLDDLKKASKSHNLVTFYGAGAKTQAFAVETALAKRLRMRDYLVLDSTELDKFNNSLIIQRNRARGSGDNDFADRIEVLRRDINDTIKKEEPFSNDLIRTAKEIHPDSKDFVDKFHNNFRKTATPEHFRTISRVMSDILSEESPILESFIRFWSRSAELYLRKTGKSYIPWRTFDGKTFKQMYPVTVEDIVSYTDPRTGRMIQQIVSTVKQPTMDLIDRTSFQKARSGYGVNGNHTNDATIVRQYHLWGRRNNVNTSTIHDAFFQNIADTVPAKQELRRLYAQAVGSDQIRNTLRAMRADGLPYLDYLRLLREAKRLNLVDPVDPLTTNEILRDILPGEDFYGVGP